jgi:ABC-type branched-subunit amino acid transport system ATPase component/ABC-type branched-subunit amino acid transport system permease subunit
MAGLALAALLLLFGGPLFLDSYQRFILALIAIYALAGLGFNVLFGWSGQLGMAHAGFFGLGAYGTGLLMHVGLPFPAALIAAALATGAIGVVLGLPAVQLRGYFLAIATLAFAALIVRVLIEAKGITGGAAGQVQPLIGFGDYDQTLLVVWWSLGACVIGFVAIYRLMGGRLGRTLKAIRDVPIIVEASGLWTARYKLIAFGISAVLAAIAGGLFGQLQTYLVPTYFDFNLTVAFLIMVVLGGMASLWGSVLGAVFVVAVVELLQNFGTFQRLAYGIAFLAVMMLLPGGLTSLPGRIWRGRGEASPTSALHRVLGFGRRSNQLRRDGLSVDAIEALQLRKLPPTQSPVLELRGIDISFGGNHVLRGVDLQFTRGFNGLIGPNGAGKTTVFNIISGYVQPGAGDVLLRGEPLGTERQWKRARAGIGRTFQTPRLVPELTAVENVMIGAHWRYGHGHLAEMLGLPRALRSERSANAKAWRLLEAFGIGASGGVPAMYLPIGSQKIVEVARALLAEPSVLLLDEPAAGLSAKDVGMLVSGLGELGADLCVILIEHDLELVRILCPRVSVLDSGQVIAEGEPVEVLAEPLVRGAYLGAAYA